MLQKQVITIPISEGLDLKTDQKQVMAGKSLQLQNVRFYKTGKIQKRFGLEPLITNTSSGTLASCFAIVSDDQAMNVISPEGVYSLSPGADQWYKMSDMKDIVKVKSDFLSKSAYNQFNPDMDYNESLGLIATVYREYQEFGNLSFNPAEYVTIVLEDIVTGVKKIRRIPTENTTAGPRRAQQKIMITVSNGEPCIQVFFDQILNQLRQVVLDKNLDDIVPQYTIEVILSLYKMDVCRDSSNVYLASMIGATLKIRKYSLAGALISTYTNVLSYGLGSSLSGSTALGFSICQTSTDIHVFFIHNIVPVPNQSYINGIGMNKNTMTTSIAETLSSGSWSRLRDIAIIANGSTIVMATTQTGAFSVDSAAVQKFTATFGASYTYIEPSILGGVTRTVVISRPFVLDGENFVVVKCPEITQPTGLVYNMDKEKFSAIFSPFGLSKSRVVQVTTTSFYTGTCNSVIALGNAYTMVEKLYGVDTNTTSSYDFNANVAISKLSLNFNNELSSGVKQKLGETNYYTNGATFSLDGRGAYESGFYLRPKIDGVTANTSGGPNPDVASKTFNYIAVYNYYNGQGEIERSVPSPAVQIVTGVNTTYLVISIKVFKGSYKDNYINNELQYGTEIVVYRTTNGGTVFYRLSSVSNDISPLNQTIFDASPDSDIINNEILYTSGGVLESDSTPNAKFSTAGGNRLFLGGLEEEDEIAYSNKQIFGEAVSFSDFYRIRISSGASADKSPMSALGYLDGKLIIFRQNSIYFIQGDGPNDTGAGATFTDPEIVSSDVGCVDPRSVLNGPNGLLFKSRKGIYLLDRGLQTSYIGAAVEDFNLEGICSALVSDKFNEARFYTEGGNCLVYNFLFNSWSTFQVQTSVNADIWANNPVSLIGGLPVKEVEESFIDDVNPYSVFVITPWLKLSGLQDFGRIYSLNILGEFKSDHTLRVTAYYDYATNYSEVYNVLPLISDSQYQYRIHLKKQKCESIQFVIEDVNPVGESMTLSALTLEVGIKSGSMKLPATRKY